ncbi:hypothetical protein BDV95DRAFT_604475 [Massariosphaeria phaeospora]|uniref:Uncharacterized protein n=1 Tax=Massariosphaeria phaeospora TaxID=100035 RepID=A0A7C8I9V6_9PLEO|nr:hypothetical protein BDV95DRAFT_604475 [Massariosphaeria phaeospora]
MQRAWTQNEEERGSSQTPRDLSLRANTVIDAILKTRKESSVRLEQTFTFWLKVFAAESLPVQNETHISILTPSPSRAIGSAVLAALSRCPDLHIHLTVLEARLTCSHTSRLPRQTACTCASLVKDAHVVLLGADGVAAVVCARGVGGGVGVKVGVVGEGVGEMIVGAEQEDCGRLEEGPTSRAWGEELKAALGGNVEVLAAGCEWVPAALADVYVTEAGILGVEDVRRMGREVVELRERVFG